MNVTTPPSELIAQKAILLYTHLFTGISNFILNAEHYPFKMKLPEESVWVFPSENPETHLDPDNFYGRVYMTALEDAKLEGVTWHTLRHTFASRLAMSGQTEGTIATLLRHSTNALVRRYSHLSPSHGVLSFSPHLPY
jgi:integrase